jgi:hypothetical protein
MDGIEFAPAKGEGDHVADRRLVVDDEDAFLHNWGDPARRGRMVPLDDGFVTVG